MHSKETLIPPSPPPIVEDVILPNFSQSWYGMVPPQKKFPLFPSKSPSNGDEM